MPLRSSLRRQPSFGRGQAAGDAHAGGGGGDAELVTEAKEYLRRKYRKPGNVYLGVVSRLDGPVSGVVVLARTSKAAARLNEQFRGRKVRENLLGDCRRANRTRQAASAPIGSRKHERQQRMVIVPKPAVGSEARKGSEARTGSKPQEARL